MAAIRDRFLDIRGMLFPGQRPFKFHYYNISSFIKPDKDWEIEIKRRFRKCKHVLISVDELDERLSQSEYREQVSKFLNHIVRVMHDTTFPVWVFSVNEIPMNAGNCFNPASPRTTDHPCNTVLKELFHSGSSKFPDQVHFLDNTDLIRPRMDESIVDVLAVIALRIYVLVGRGVRFWRANGQIGKVDGLHRNGTVEPNYELVPYDGW